MSSRVFCGDWCSLQDVSRITLRFFVRSSRSLRLSKYRDHQDRKGIAKVRTVLHLRVTFDRKRRSVIASDAFTGCALS